jgi:hypothetical protein
MRIACAINEVTGRHYRRIESFNDHPDTDHARARAPAPVGWYSRQSARAGRVGSSNGPLGQQVLSG